MAETVVITDTSCFILLDNINSLDLLNVVYGNVLTTPEVATEFKKQLPAWVKVVPVVNRDLIDEYHQTVDLGEASAIALSQEVFNALLVVDDFKGRRLAAQLNIRFTGTIGVLITARQQNKIASLRPYFNAINLTNFRIIPAILDRILADFND